MSAREWTPAQKQAITTRGGDLLISAAAGSGKTAVLTERVLTLITDPERPVDIDRLLIVTFSNAAAEEMRQRIAARLYERMEQEPENAVLRRQSLLLGNAEICTIHAFCYRLIRENFQALGLPGDLSSQSRFVRVAYTKMNSKSGDSEEESVSQFFHILGSVDQQRGCCEVADGKYEITIYTSCCNASRGIYYYTTYDNHQICAVDMHRENLDGSELSRYALLKKERIFYQN